MLELQKIEQWELMRLVDRLHSGSSIIDLQIVGFKVHEGGVSLLRISPGRISEIKTLSAEDLQWYKDVYGRQEHVALHVTLKNSDNVILVGFWSANIDGLRQKITEITAPEQPDENKRHLIETGVLFSG